MGKIQSGKLLYHLTKLDNLRSILESGLCSRRLLNGDAFDFEDVADVGIISRRTELGLDQYIPFHFHPYSAFDVAVKNEYPHDEFVYICLSRDIARANDFKILKQHPLTIAEAVLYDYDDGIAEIDWDTMEISGRSDTYSKHVRMAECLTDRIVPARFFNQICVRNEEVRDQVLEMLDECNIDSPPPYVNIQVWLNR